MEKLKILFVDDEPKVLSGLRRTLRPMKTRWEMQFVESGPEALQLLEKDTVDVIVSDMRMPRMDGTALLQEVMKRWPKTVRIILSGQSKKEGILRSFGCAHQYLSKPASSHNIVAAVERANKVRTLIHNSHMDFMMRLSLLPSPSKTYERLSGELLKDSPSLRIISEIISADVAVSAKIIQLVNSAYYGFSREICDIHTAVTMMGFDSIRPIAFLGNFLAEVNSKDVALKMSLERLFVHSFNVAKYSEKIVSIETQNTALAKQAYACGLLHDCGILVLASNLGESYDQLMEKSTVERRPLHEVEYEALDISHAEVGAYLLDLWGLPDSIIEAAGYHHCIEKITTDHFIPVVAIHSADIIDAVVSSSHPGGIDEAFLNSAVLERIGLADSFQRWQTVCSN